MKIGVAQPVGGDAVQCWCWNYAGKCGWRGKADMSGAFHLTFSASEVFLGVAVSDWPLPYAVLTYRSPSFVIFVVQPVFQVITAELPSSFQVPVIPSPRVAFAAPSLDSVISNGCPAVSFTFHTPSKALAASAAKLVTTKKQAAVTAAVAAFLIFVPSCKFKARGGNGAKEPRSATPRAWKSTSTIVRRSAGRGACWACSTHLAAYLSSGIAPP